MEGRLWEIVVTLVQEVQGEKQRRERYSAGTILVVGLWAILHDRPFCWACEAAHWPERWRPPQLPHPSTLSRRWRREELHHLAAAVHHQALQQLPVTTIEAAIDGKPLVVSEV